MRNRFVKAKSRFLSWTLIEMVMVMVIVGILAATAVVKINDVVKAGKVSKAVSEVNIIKKALLTFYGDVGFFPPDADAGVDPGLASNTGGWSNWNGPYIDSWPSQTPWDGEYEYNYGSYSAFDKDGTSGNEVYIAINKGTANLTKEVCTEVDKLLDDGTLTTGNVRSDGSTYIYIYVAEGPNS